MDKSAEERRKVAFDQVKAAEEAVEQLRSGLAAAGIVLPSLRIDPVSCSGDGPVNPLVELGRCNLATARQMAAVLEEGARP
ncbi:hypothetical protein [Streptomyces sp. NPDC058653]|uniref:hypothetical protein n=1 Tax=Streptomyces sp. NPDC058653 TaxID=3346576 RepID=UPI00365E57C3